MSDLNIGENRISYQIFIVVYILYGRADVFRVSNVLDPDLSVLIWIQTVCKCYQQMTNVAASKERVHFLNTHHCSNRLENYLNKQDYLEKSLKTKF